MCGTVNFMVKFSYIGNILKLLGLQPHSTGYPKLVARICQVSVIVNILESIRDLTWNTNNIRSNQFVFSCICIHLLYYYYFITNTVWPTLIKFQIFVPF